MRTRIGIAIVLAGVWSGACSSGVEPPAGVDEVTVRAETILVERRAVRLVREVPGTVRAAAKTVVSAEVLGVIEALRVDEGDRVERGQIMIEIRDERAAAGLRQAMAAEEEARQALVESERMITAAEAALSAATAQRDLAETTRGRFAVLRERGSISPQEYDEVESRLSVATAEVRRAAEGIEGARARRMQALSAIVRAEAAVEAAGIVVAQARIAAPIDGVVVSRPAEEGMLAAPGVELLTIEDDSAWEIEAAVPESLVRDVRIGDEAPVRIDLLERDVTGTVTEIVPSADPITRTFLVRLALDPGEETGLRSGSFGRVAIPGGDREAIVVPSEAIVSHGQLDGVYLVDPDGRAIFRLVETGSVEGGETEILSGLDAGDRIVTRSVPGLVEGVLVDDADGAGAR